MLIENLFIPKQYQHLITLAKFLEEGQPIIIFGAGNLGKKVAAFLIAQHNDVIAFSDNNQEKWGSEILNIKVRGPQHCTREMLTHAVWIVSIWSPGHSYENTKRQLQSLGVSHIFHAAVLMQLFPNELLPHYHFQTPEYFIHYKDEIQEVYENLADEESKKQFYAHVDCRINLNFKGLPIADTQNQYFPEGIITLSKDEVFLDAGAYDGDTLKDFINRADGKFKKYIALEPDPLNYDKLEKVSESLPHSKIEIFPYAVSSENTILRFDSTGGGGAGLSERGSIEVECKKIDDYFYNYRPTYLKFDIEGAELDALKGAHKTIEKFKPKLGVCIYHLPQDLWQIFLYLHQNFPFYDYYSRTHQYDGLDFVLYAIPK